MKDEYLSSDILGKWGKISLTHMAVLPILHLLKSNALTNQYEKIIEEMMMMNLKEKTYLLYFIPLRLWIGYYFLQQGTRKFLRGFPQSDWIGKQIGDIATIDIYSWYKSFLTIVVVPNRELFGYLIAWGEIMVGLCLFLGMLTRFSSIIGLFVLLNYCFGYGMAKGGASLAQQQTFIVAIVVFILANPGRTLGLDAFLFKKR